MDYSRSVSERMRRGMREAQSGAGEQQISAAMDDELAEKRKEDRSAMAARAAKAKSTSAGQKAAMKSGLFKAMGKVAVDVAKDMSKKPTTDNKASPTPMAEVVTTDTGKGTLKAGPALQLAKPGDTRLKGQAGLDAAKSEFDRLSAQQRETEKIASMSEEEFEKYSRSGKLYSPKRM